MTTVGAIRAITLPSLQLRWTPYTVFLQLRSSGSCGPRLIFVSSSPFQLVLYLYWSGPTYIIETYLYWSGPTCNGQELLLMKFASRNARLSVRLSRGAIKIYCG